MDIHTIAIPDMALRFEALVEGLIQNEFGLSDQLFSPTLISALRQNLLSHYQAGRMHPAGIGKKFDYQRNAQVRGDLIRWMDHESTDAAEIIFLQTVRDFYHYLNASCYTGINDFEFHYAYYEEGSFFKRHRDQFRSDRGRVLSFVLYLNDGWEESHGGKVSLYLDKGPVHLLPHAGRVITFRSDQVEHEVHPSRNRPRLSIAGWLKRS